MRIVQTSRNVDEHDVSLYENVPNIVVGHVNAAAASVPEMSN